MIGIVLAHGKAADVVARHLPNWQATFGRIVLICPADDPLPNALLLGISEHRGRDTIERLKFAVSLAAQEKAAAILEYDTLFFTGRFPDEEVGENRMLCSELRKDVSPQPWMVEPYGHSPWLATQSTWRRILAAAGDDEQNGYGDRWLAMACRNAGIALMGLVDGFSHDESWTPENLQKAAEAVRRGAPVVHGIKTARDFEAVMAARQALQSGAVKKVGGGASLQLRSGQATTPGCAPHDMLLAGMNIPQVFARAFEEHKAGRLKEAEALYHQILAIQPDHADALHFLGVLACQCGQPALAITCIQKAVAIDPYNFASHSNLGESLRKAGRLPEAEASLRRALALQSGHADAHNNLGAVLKEMGRVEEAADCYRRALALRPDFPEAYNNLGNALGEEGRLAEALAAFGQALQLRPEYAEARANRAAVIARTPRLAAVVEAVCRAMDSAPADPWLRLHLAEALHRLGRLPEAVAQCRRAIELKPDYADAHVNLGNALRELGENHAAEAAFRRALELDPRLAGAWNNLGITLAAQGRLEEAEEMFREALRIEPNAPDIHNNLGNALKDQGLLEKALAAYRRCLALDPAFRPARSNLIYMLQFDPAMDEKDIAAEHAQWNRQFANPLRPFILPHRNDPDPERRLRVEYVSPDFRYHAEAFFVVPLLEAHDHGPFEIHCYASVARPDQITARLRRCADGWHEVQGFSDEQLADQIRADGMDILIDLTMHMADNRLPVFARKPAPVQAAWIAYPGSTGLEAMDYRITDRFLEPPDVETPYYPEKAVRLPDCWCCYDPLADGPAVNAPPSLADGRITFGCLNAFCKVNAPTLDLFAEILRGVKGSRLRMLAPAGGARERLRAQLEGRGMESGRVDFVGPADRARYLQYYHQIDIALDVLPYNGITTSCDALWMGVPVVSLTGKTAPGRAGLGILTTIGLPELAAPSAEAFVDTATRLATDPPRLEELRRTLRGRMEGSPLMDGPRFARNMEAAYRAMWRSWCSA